MAIPLQPPDSDDEQAPLDDEALEILEKVEMKLFEADPPNLSPFGYSILRWEVEGPRSTKWLVELGSEPVQNIGTRLVNPAVTTTYYLRARVRSVRKPLGVAQVVVNNQACEMIQLNPQQEFFDIAKGFVEGNPDLYFQHYLDSNKQLQIIKPVVTFSTGKISFSLRLFGRTKKWYAIDPFVDIDASFGLAISHGISLHDKGELVAKDQQVNVEVSLPWYVWNLLPYAVIYEVMSDLSKKEIEIRDLTLKDGIPKLVEYLNFKAVFSPKPEKRLRTVHVSKGIGNMGAVDIMACPSELFNDFARISRDKSSKRQ